jgi:hypothetical protein
MVIKHFFTITFILIIVLFIIKLTNENNLLTNIEEKDENSLWLLKKKFTFIKSEYLYCEKLLNINNQLRNIEQNVLKRSKNKFFNKILKKEYDKACSLIQESYDTIWNYNYNIVEKIPDLNELNDRISFYYRHMNEKNALKINNIPIIQISKHHHAVEWIYKNINENIGTILHVDSHADLNPILNTKKFLIKFKNSLLKTDKMYKKFYRCIEDIGAVLVPFLLPYEKNNGIVWLTPDWVTEPFNNSKVYLSKSKKYSYYYGGTCPYYTNKMNGNYYKSGDMEVEFSTSNIMYIPLITDKISDDYILNIDLDYFVTYGDSYYGTIGNDAISHYRTYLDLGYCLKDSYNYEIKTQELEFEMNQIKKRIDNFINFIKLLKQQNKYPKIIIICDSTSVNYCLYNEKFIVNESELKHEFTPKYLSLWIHNLVIKNLKKILD